MHQDVSTIHVLSSALGEKLKGYRFHEAYSLSKNELLLVFRKEELWFTFRMLTQWKTCLLFFDEAVYLKPSNAQSLFEGLRDKPVLLVRSHVNNRSFQMDFGGEKFLLFKMYNALANVMLVEELEVLELFRDAIKNDLQVSMKAFVVSDKPASSSAHSFIITGPDEASPNYTFEMGEDAKENTVFQSSAIFEALTRFGRLFASQADFNEKKQQLIHQFTQKIKHAEGILLKSREGLMSMDEGLSPEQIGHIIMANLHLIKRGEARVTLNDFYHQGVVEVKLNKDLAPQENAAHYYRKAKNRHKEMEVIQKRIKDTNLLLQQHIAALDRINEACSLKELKPYIQTEQKEEQSRLPFKTLQREGYEIWIGRSATNNDLLITRYAHKEDMWLHAKGVPGSHVIIRHQGKKAIPAQVIEYAASLAAYHSKAKGSSLVPVTYTLKKFVRKPKGAEPGQVAVLNEETIMICPAPK